MFPNSFLKFENDTAQVPPAGVGLNDNSPLHILAKNLIGTLAFSQAGDGVKSFIDKEDQRIKKMIQTLAGR